MSFLSPRFSALSRRLTCLLGGSLLMLATPATFAANGTWDGDGADANWTTLENWSGDAAFPGATSGETNGDTAIFNSAIANTWGAPGTPILIDSASLNLKGITFETSSVGNYTIGTTDGHALYLTSGGSIKILDSTPAATAQTVSAPLIIVGENATYTFNNGRDKIESKLILNGDIAAGSSGAATLNFYGKQGASPNEANGIISDGAADHVSLSHQTGTWYYTGDNTYTGDTTIHGGSARFTGDNSGGGNFTINSGGAAYFTGTNSYTGSFSLIGGSSTANAYLGADDSATGSILGVTDISISGGRLYIDNTAGNADRLNDNVAISLAGTSAILSLTGNSDADTTETVGAITLGQGNANLAITAQANRVHTLNAASLTRTAQRGTLQVSARGLGSGGTSYATGFNLTTPLAGIDLIGTGGLPADVDSNIKNLAIIPWIYGDDSGNGKLVTYDTTNGLRFLSTNESQSTISGADTPGIGETGDNVFLTASETGITTKTINSLMLSPGADQAITGAGAGNTLTISSGALALTNARTATLSGFDSITFGNAEAVITPNHGNGAIQFDSAIEVTNGGGITKAGGGTLILNAGNHFSGLTVVNQGTLQIGTGGTTGDLGTGDLRLNAGTTLNYNRTDSLDIGSISGGGTTSGGGAIVLSQATGALTAYQAGTGNVITSIKGAAGSTFVFAGNGETTLKDKPSTSGQLIRVDSGTVNLAKTRQFESNLEINGGVVNTLDAQTSFRLGNAGTQTLTINGGEFNVTGQYGVKGLNSDNNGASYGSTFIGTQTGGLFSITGGSSDGLQIGNTVAGASTTYNLSGGVLSYTGTASDGLYLLAGTDGKSTATFNFSGGTLISAQNIKGYSGNGAKQAFVWTGGVLATAGYRAANLSSTAGTAVDTSINTLVNAGGTLAPGDIGTTGRTTITGNYAVTSPDAALHIDIAGTTASGAFQDAPGAGRHDIVTFSGGDRIVDLAGKLYVNLIDDFNGYGSFTIINNTGSGGEINGTFNNLVADAFGGNGRVVLDNGVSSYSVTIGATAVTLDSFVADNVWTGSDDTNWSEAIWWSAFSPQAAGQIAQFTTEVDGGNVNLDTDRTIGGITFDNASDRYTISSNNGSSLTLDNTRLAGPADSAITVTAGTHTIAVPMTLANNLNIETTGTASALTVNGAISGTGQALAKTGTGSLTLAAANDYTGNTAVAAGTLFANNTTGSATGTGLLSIASGATLAGSGAIGGIADISGHIAAGATAGSMAVLTFNQAVTLRAGSTIGIDIHGATTRGLDYDALDFNGALTLEGTELSFNFGSAIANGSVLNIFGGDTALTAGFTSVSASGFGDYNGSFSLNDGNTAYTAIFGSQTVSLDLASGNLSFTGGSAIPEPAAAALLFGALTLAVGACRRSRGAAFCNYE